VVWNRVGDRDGSRGRRWFVMLLGGPIQRSAWWGCWGCWILDVGGHFQRSGLVNRNSGWGYDRRSRGCSSRRCRGILQRAAPDVSTNVNILAILSEKALLFLVQPADLANWDCHCVPNFLVK